MPDVREVLTHRIGDVDLAQVDTEASESAVALSCVRSVVPKPAWSPR